MDRQPLSDGRVRVRFATTMLMSTYLVAFVVGPLEVARSVDVDGVPLRVIAPSGPPLCTRTSVSTSSASSAFGQYRFQYASTTARA